MAKRFHRRKMLQGAALAGAGLWTIGLSARAEGQSPNEKLNVAFVGVGARGRANLDGVAREGVNVVALCDVDEERAGDAFTKYPQAKKYADFRKMLDELDRTIDAVVVSTPDHTHAPAAAMALKMGKHCYCEKPLAHSVYEARVLARLAAEKKVATQLGTQHHARAAHREVVALIQSGAIGAVREVHATIGGSRGGGERPTETPPVPPHLNWDLWLGPAPYRPYHPDYVPYKFRFWWDFGTGETGNNGVHVLGIPFAALRLRRPTSVESEGPPVHPETSPTWMTMRFQFPARGEMPPVTLNFYHSAKLPPPMAVEGLAEWKPNVLFVGEKGMLAAEFGRWKLLPESKFADVMPPKALIPESIGHYKEWVVACKTGSPTTCHFDYGGALTETILLGNVAYRAGEKLTWDAENLRATNCPKAERFINPPYRQGWTL